MPGDRRAPARRPADRPRDGVRRGCPCPDPRGCGSARASARAPGGEEGLWRGGGGRPLGGARPARAYTHAPATYTRAGVCVWGGMCVRARRGHTPRCPAWRRAPGVGARPVACACAMHCLRACGYDALRGRGSPRRRHGVGACAGALCVYAWWRCTCADHKGGARHRRMSPGALCMYDALCVHAYTTLCVGAEHQGGARQRRV